MVKKWVFQRESNNKYSCITNAFSSKHAQGTIEYLVMMAVIVVVGLVVVGLVANQTDSFQGVSSSTSKLSSSLGVISVNEAVVDGDGNGLISFSNNSGDLLIITKLSIEGIDFNYPSTNLFQGEKKIFSLNELGSGCSCVGLEGETKTCEVIVHATSEHGLEKQFTTNVSVDCVSDVVAKNPAVVIVPVEPVVESEGVAPLVLLLSPVDNNFWDSSSTVVFDFNVWDDSVVSSCGLLVNGIDVNSIVPTIGINSISYNLSDVNFVWDVNCVDEWDNVGHASSVFSLSVDANAYQINNCLQLQDMNLDLGGDYFLMNDINCYDNTHSGGVLYNGGAGFLPVGNSVNKFTGSFDGNYHTVNELYLNRVGVSGVGLFGYTYGATVLKVGIVGGTFHAQGQGGPLIGDANTTTVSNCYGNVTISTGNFNAGALLGGLVGSMDGGIIEKSYVVGNIYGGAYYIGGLVGHFISGTITDCYTTGNVGAGRESAGGIVGGSSPGTKTISNSYSTGTISAGYQGYAGGLVGGYGLSSDYTIKNSFSTGDIGGGSSGGLAAGSTATIINSYYLFTGTYNYGTLETGGVSAFYNSTHGVYTGSPAWDFNTVWGVCEGTSYPTLKWENKSC